MGGTATDNTAVTSVDWVNAEAVTAGTATDTSGGSWATWTANISLVVGTNTITVTVSDGSGNTSTGVITVTLDPVNPGVTITTPTSLPTYAGGATPLLVGGTASDNFAIASVDWVNAEGATGGAATDTSGGGDWSTWDVLVGLVTGINTITVTVTDEAGNTSTDVLTVTYTPPDITPPTVQITSPTTGATLSTSSLSIDLGGVAADNVGVSSVTWTHAEQGGGGTALGTTSWNVPLLLIPGPNTLTVTAADAAGGTATDVIVVTLDQAAPQLTVDPTLPTTTTSPFTITGTALDNGTVASVTWSNATTGDSGPATGTGTWTAVIPLVPGSNVITLVVWDAAGNTATSTVLVDYFPSDIISPTVTITIPTSADAFLSGTTPIALDGTTTDDVAVLAITWENETTGVGGTAFSSGPWGIWAPLTSGSNVITVTAVDMVGNVGTDTLNVDYFPAPDAIIPGVAISQGVMVSTASNPVSLSGSASDNLGLTSITWTNDATGGSGIASGTGTWFIPVPLAPGANLVTLAATDPSGNVTNDTIVVTFNPTPGDTISPIVNIQSPTSAPTLTTSTEPLLLGGLAADDTALATVVWSNAATGATGTTSGTSSWNATIPLLTGDNVITVTAYDTNGNSGTGVITVTYQPPPPPGGGGGGGGGGCGGLGLEWLLPMGLAWIFRRRRIRNSGRPSRA